MLQVYQLIDQSVDLIHCKLVGNLSIDSFTKVGIIGENGIGKTSFLKFLKKEQDRIFRTQCSILDQVRLKPIANLKVSDIYELVNKELRAILKQPLNDENSLVKEFDFQRQSQKEISDLSGGENQMLKVIIALNFNVEVYILDEPFSNLSLKNKEKLKKIINESKKTFLIIDHDQKVLSEVCSRRIEFYKAGSVLKIREFV